MPSWPTQVNFGEIFCYSDICCLLLLFCYNDFIIKSLVSYYDVLCCHDEPIVMFSVPSFPHSNNSQDTTLIVGCTKRNIFIIFNLDNLTNQIQNYFLVSSLRWIEGKLKKCIYQAVKPQFSLLRIEMQFRWHFTCNSIYSSWTFNPFL